MKKLIFISFIVAALCSCGPHMYSTRSSGQDNIAYVIVLANSGQWPNVTLEVDGVSHPISKVYKVKAARKAHPVVITPGKHTIKVFQGGKELINENIFIGLQETKKIVLR